MPALQVREFPADLYEELKRYAETHRRSVAQQTIACVEKVIRADRNEFEIEPVHGEERRTRSRALDVMAPETLATNAEKKRRAVSCASQIRWAKSVSCDDIVRAVLECRDGRDFAIANAIEETSGSSADDQHAGIRR